MPSWARSLRAGPRGRRAPDRRGGRSPCERHDCLVVDRPAGPPPGRPAQSPPPARTSRRHLSGRGPPRLVARLVAALGAAYTLAGRAVDAVALLTQAMEQATAMERADVQTPCCLSLGEAQLLAGRLEDAHTLAERALTLARQHQERGNQAYALRLLGEIAAHRAPPDVNEAAAHYRHALTLAEELSMRPLQAHCHRDLGTLYAKTGRQEQACAELSTAIEMYRAMDMTFWLPQAEAALARVEG